MKRSRIATSILLCIIALECTNCNPNHHQEKFRQLALSPPSGIQAMTASGEHKADSEADSSDWQTAPEFAGLFEVVTPAYPNPVPYNTSFSILINVKGFNAVNQLIVYAIRQPGNLRTAPPVKIIPRTLQPGLHTIKIHPAKFAQSSGTGSLGNLYRILFVDGRNQIVTYGDIRVK